MKSLDKKTEFIRMRGEGMSYATISSQLKISKSTCTEWERVLNGQIAEYKKDRLEELHTLYCMTKDARIKRIGDTLNSIDIALEAKDMSSLSTEKLLDAKLKYMLAQKNEYTPIGKEYIFSDNIQSQEILNAYKDLISDIRTGNVTAEHATWIIRILENMQKSCDILELKTKLEALEAAQEVR